MSVHIDNFYFKGKEIQDFYAAYLYKILIILHEEADGVKWHKAHEHEIQCLDSIICGFQIIRQIICYEIWNNNNTV